MKKTKRCRHENGWCSVEKQTIWTDEMYHVAVGFSGRNKVLMTCNNTQCPMVRNAYFMMNGAFVRFGKVRKGR